MKLAVVISVFLASVVFALPAGADVLNPPGGPVYVDDAPDVAQPPPQHQRRDGARGPRDPMARAKQQRLRAALVEQFDANGDGRLGPRERMRAIRVLRRLEGRLAGGRQGQRGAKLRKFIQRYDVNGDGNVGPDEMPRGAANKMRRFDRDGDGWVEPRELGGRR